MKVIQYTGGKITEPGCYVGLPIDTYHSDCTEGFSTSHSGLDLIFKKSPAHFYDQSWLNPKPNPRKVTKAMDLGKAAHHLFLGERDFQKHYIRRPAKAPDGRQWHASNLTCVDWIERHSKPGITVVTPDQIDDIVGMKVALEHHPMVRAGILAGRIEQSFVWRDEETGIWLKARPDVIPNHTGDFADLKCTADVSDDAMERSIESFGYARQAALVLEGASHVLGLPLKFRGPGEGEGMSFSLVFIESDRPHCIEVVTLKPLDIQAAMVENHAALRLMKRCLDTGRWPGPSGEQKDARYFGLSKWAAERNAYRVSQIRAMLEVGE